MKLPLSLLRAAKDHPLLVEVRKDWYSAGLRFLNFFFFSFFFLVLLQLKNGETYNGNLVSCDNYMNLNLSDVICTSRDADAFFKIDFVYIRGIQIKYLCVPQETIALVKDEVKDAAGGGGGGRGRGRGRGRGNDNNKGAAAGAGAGAGGNKRGRGGR